MRHKASDSEGPKDGEDADSQKAEQHKKQSSLVSWLTSGNTSYQDAAAQALQFADESRVSCIEQWQLRRSIHKTSKAAMRTLLDSFQEKEETRVALFKDCLRRLTVIESSYLANLQYDVQMLAGVMESVKCDSQEGGDIRLLINCTEARHLELRETRRGDLPSTLPLTISHNQQEQDQTQTQKSQTQTQTQTQNDCCEQRAVDEAGADSSTDRKDVKDSCNADVPPPNPKPVRKASSDLEDVFKHPPPFEPLTVQQLLHAQLPLGDSNCSQPYVSVQSRKQTVINAAEKTNKEKEKEEEKKREKNMENQFDQLRQHQGDDTESIRSNTAEKDGKEDVADEDETGGNELDKEGSGKCDVIDVDGKDKGQGRPALVRSNSFPTKSPSPVKKVGSDMRKLSRTLSGLKDSKRKGKDKSTSSSNAFWSVKKALYGLPKS